MNANFAAQESLLRHLDLRETAAEILSIDHLASPTERDIRKAYCTLAMLIHPDRCTRDSHYPMYQRMFIKAQGAHDLMLQRLVETGARKDEDGATEAEHGVLDMARQRNVDFRAKQKAYKQRCLDIVREYEWKTQDTWGWARASVSRFEQRKLALRQIWHQDLSAEEWKDFEPEEWKTLPKYYQSTEREARRSRLFGKEDPLHEGGLGKAQDCDPHLQLEKDELAEEDVVVTARSKVRYQEAKKALESGAWSSRGVEGRKITGASKTVRDDVVISREFQDRERAAKAALPRNNGCLQTKRNQIKKATWRLIKKDLQKILGKNLTSTYLGELEEQGLPPLSVILGEGNKGESDRQCSEEARDRTYVPLPWLGFELVASRKVMKMKGNLVEQAVAFLESLD